MTVFPFKYVIGKQKLDVQKYSMSGFLKVPKSLSGWVDEWVSGWVDGWVGGDQTGPSILLIFKYMNKPKVLIPNMLSKLVYVL